MMPVSRDEGRLANALLYNVIFPAGVRLPNIIEILLVGDVTIPCTLTLAGAAAVNNSNEALANT